MVFERSHLPHHNAFSRSQIQTRCPQTFAVNVRPDMNPIQCLFNGPTVSKNFSPVNEMKEYLAKIGRLRGIFQALHRPAAADVEAV